MSLFLQHTDQDLFRLISGGNEAAFAELFRRYDKRIYPFVLKMIKIETLAEEITQEIFIKIWHNREKLSSIDIPQSYIFTITSHHTLDHIKKQLNEGRMLQRLSATLPPSHNDPEEALLLRDKEALVQQAIKQLPPQQRSVYLLSRQQGLSYEEIGRLLNISPNTVRNHLVKALATMRTWLESQDHLPTLLMAFSIFFGKKL